MDGPTLTLTLNLAHPRCTFINDRMAGRTEETLRRGPQPKGYTGEEILRLSNRSSFSTRRDGATLRREPKNCHT